MVLLSACASRPETGAAPGPERSQPAQIPERPTLRIAVQREPSLFNNVLPTAAESSGGLRIVKQIPHNQLVVLNDRGVWIPQLAAEQLSVQQGTWRVNADGTMDTIWKLRPNVKWHDGVPFTADDLMFSFTVYKDRDLPNSVGASLRLMDSVSAPDPRTFVVHWSAPYAFADQEPAIDPLPRHRLEELYLTDKAQLRNSPLLREGFVGLGAYQLASWEQGSHLEFVPFDDYYLGPPPLGRLVVRIITDLNTMVANILAGTLDVVIDVGVSLETGVEVRDRWQGTGHQVHFVAADKPRWIEVQHRAEYARPTNGLTNRTVRQAFMHGIDREALVQLLTAGLGSIADSWVLPNDAARGQLAESIPQYPYNPTRAQQLLAEVGWSRGPTGVLAHRTSAETFQVEVRFADDTESEKMMTVVADNWSTLGAQATIFELTPALKSNNEFRTKFSGVAGSVSPDLPVGPHLHSRFIATAETRWTGGRAGYSNPTVDVLLDRYAVTIDGNARLALHKELLTHVISDVAFMPMYWRIEPVLAVSGVTGLKGRDAWNVHEWTKQ
jgi:peptide/nickel transport system substrate-binding protein